MFWLHRPGGTVLPAMTKIQFLQATGSLFRSIKLCPGIEGSSLRRGALRGLPAPSRLRRPLEKLLGMEAAFCETKVQSVPHVILRKTTEKTPTKKTDLKRGRNHSFKTGAKSVKHQSMLLHGLSAGTLSGEI